MPRSLIAEEYPDRQQGTRRNWKEERIVYDQIHPPSSRNDHLSIHAQSRSHEEDLKSAGRIQPNQPLLFLEHVIVRCFSVEHSEPGHNGSPD